MPNWCDNSLTLSHNDPTLIARAKKAFIDGKLFEEFVPIPTELKEAIAPNTSENADVLQAKYGYTDWYDFCVNNWGTKWDTHGDESNIIDSSENSITISFSTAWSPPVAIYEKLEEMGFSVNATYYEPGMAYVGRYVDGHDETYEYGHMTADEVEQEIPADLNEEYGISDYMRDYDSDLDLND